VTSTPGSIHHGYQRNCRLLERLLSAAADTDLRRRSAGTRWTNEELLFHMVFGYMVVQALLPLVRIFGALAAPLSRVFAFDFHAAQLSLNSENHGDEVRRRAA